MDAIRFGTDGWRGLIAGDFTFANVARVAQAAADEWGERPAAGRERRVILGYDRRFLSPEFARLTAEVFAGNAFEVLLTPVPSPTPAVSFAVRERNAAGGVMITASHNPAAFNGFKLKAWFGGAADATLCRAVEERVDASPVRRVAFSEAVRSGRVREVDLRSDHVRAVRRLVDLDRLARARLRVGHDVMWGVGAGCFQALLAGTRCRVTTLRGAHDPLFGGIRPEPIPEFYGETSAWLRAHPQDVCLVSDGDADRLGALDERGRPLTTHQVIALVLWHLLANRGARGTVVKSLNTTSLVDRLAAAHGVEVEETGIGFKEIGARLIRPGVLVGVEESGSIGLAAHLPERDGLAAGMLLLELLAVEGRPVSRVLASIERRFGAHRYARLDLAVAPGEGEMLLERVRRRPPRRLGESPVVRVDDFDGLKCTARDGCWLMFRGSGTEPLVRVYAEARTRRAVVELVRAGARRLQER